jgi:hypothetical protein
MDLGGWLRKLALERCEEAFRENEVDEAVLPNLTQEDLKEIGVGPAGHRRKLMKLCPKQELHAPTSRSS